MMKIINSFVVGKTPLITSILGALFFSNVVLALGVTDTSSPGSVYFLPGAGGGSENSSGPDSIEPQSGNLWIKQKDMILPGNGGLDLTVWRTYSMMRASAAMTATLTGSYRWAQLGPGWSIDVAPKLSVENFWLMGNSAGRGFAYYRRNLLVDLCTTNTSHAQFSVNTTKQFNQGALPVIEHPDGSVENIYSIGNHEAWTKSNWRIRCINNVVTAVSPGGITYDYGNISERRIGERYLNQIEADPYWVEASFVPPHTETYMVAKSASDLNGNRMTYTYKTLGAPFSPWAMPGYIQQPPNRWAGYGDLAVLEKPVTLLTKVVASDGRVVDFIYNDSTARLSEISSNTGLTVKYGYLNPDKLNSRALNAVKYSTGESWGYSYFAGAYKQAGNMENDGLIEGDVPTISARKLKSITYPAGGVASFTYTYSLQRVHVRHRDSRYTLRSVGEKVSSRSLSTGGVWNYSYQKGTGGTYDVTTINGPEGKTVLKYVGPSYKVSLAPVDGSEETVWMVGSLIEKTDPLGNTEFYTWQPRTITGGKEVVVDLGYAMDTAIRAADIQVKKIVRAGVAYTTTYSNYDIYGNPGTRTEVGPNGGSRTTTLSYFNDPNKWIIGHLKSEVSPGVSMTRTFDANGKVLTETRDGVTTKFTYDAQGNIASKTTPGGRVYTYSNYKRGIAQTETHPEGITLTRVVDNAGNITSETNGEGKTTTYTYDGLNRQTSFTPPVGSRETIAYTPTSKTATRGALVEKTVYGPFGHPASVTLAGVTRTFTYDGLGRKNV
ncbi:hypothetical protein [Pseudomonas sp. R3-41]